MTENTGTIYNYIFGVYSKEDEEDQKKYHQQIEQFWSSKDFRYDEDIPRFKALSADERYLVEMILGFFAPADGLVANNLALRFMSETKSMMSLAFFTAQLHIEFIHADTYARWVKTLIPDQKEQRRIFEMAETNPAVKLKTDWMVKHMNANTGLDERFLAFACVEWIFFSVLFAIIFWFRSQAKMQEFVSSNRQISKDEALHALYGCMMFKRHRTKGFDPMPTIFEAVEIETSFVKALLPKPILDLNAESMIQYIHCVADLLMIEAGIPAYYNAKNPFPWMTEISLGAKENFHELPTGIDYRRRTQDEYFQPPTDFNDVDF